MDAFPAKPGGLALLNYFTYYDTGADANRSLVLRGLLAADVDATIYADTIAAVYQTPWNVLGCSFAVGMALAEVKWLPELDVDKRMKGDSIGFKFGFLF